jgi:ABC-type transport system involved in cytochrome bd biosynthesis fused ATPase/permease subunit
MKKLIHFIRPYSSSLLIAGALAGISLSMSVGLLGTSAWLISMASTRPPILVLEVAIVAVRFFGLGRGVIRYFSRIREHDTALTIQTKIPAINLLSDGIENAGRAHRYPAGKILQQVTSDSESIQDLWLRVGLPWFASLISGAAGISIIFILDRPFGILAGLIFVGAMWIVPFVSVLTSAKSEERDAEEKLFDGFVQACDSIQESLVFGNDETVRNELASIQQTINRNESKLASVSGISELLHHIFAGLTVIFGIIAAAHGYSAGRLAGVNIAVIVLIPLAIYDGLPVVFTSFAHLSTLRERAESLSEYLKEIPVDATPKECDQDSVTLQLTNLVPSTVKGRISPVTAVASPSHPLLLQGRSGSGKSSITQRNSWIPSL